MRDKLEGEGGMTRSPVALPNKEGVTDSMNCVILFKRTELTRDLQA